MVVCRNWRYWCELMILYTRVCIHIWITKDVSVYICVCVGVWRNAPTYVFPGIALRAPGKSNTPAAFYRPGAQIIVSKCHSTKRNRKRLTAEQGQGEQTSLVPSRHKVRKHWQNDGEWQKDRPAWKATPGAIWASKKMMIVTSYNPLNKTGVHESTRI